MIDQVTLLTQEIKDSFSEKIKAGTVFVDLTAAYDTVWHRGLTCKLLRFLPDSHMVSFIMELFRNHSFTLTPFTPAKQVTTSEKRRSTGISPGTSLIQHLHA